jgi:predicted transposase YdaD
LWKQRPEPWWEQQPGLMALYPLCQHGMELPQALVYAASAIRRRELDSARRADLLTTLGIFGRLKNRTLDALSIIGREQMRESPFYQQILEEGRQLHAREAVLQVLTIRFGPEAAKEQEEAVNRIENLEQLEELHKIAIKSRRFSQFRRAVAAM